jgi:hypothetical protein
MPPRQDAVNIEPVCTSSFVLREEEPGKTGRGYHPDHGLDAMRAVGQPNLNPMLPTTSLI